jgi:hypothetical protein
MKSLLLVLALALLPGCMSMPAMVRELGKDPATLSMNVNTIYGTVRIIRIGTHATNQVVTIDPSGTITIHP